MVRKWWVLVVASSYGFNQISCLFADVRSEGDHIIPQDVLAFLVVILALERCRPMNKLKQQNPEAPNIQLKVVRLVLDHLRGHIVERSTEGVPGPRRRVILS